MEDGPGDGFTILSAKSLFLGQKVNERKLREEPAFSIWRCGTRYHGTSMIKKTNLSQTRSYNYNHYFIMATFQLFILSFPVEMSWVLFDFIYKTPDWGTAAASPPTQLPCWFKQLTWAKSSDAFVTLQLSLTESEISKIGSIKVEAIINPTNAEMDLKDGVGKAQTPRDVLTSWIPPGSPLHRLAPFRRRAGKSWRQRIPGGSEGAEESTGPPGGGIRYWRSRKNCRPLSSWHLLRKYRTSEAFY